MLPPTESVTVTRAVLDGEVNVVRTVYPSMRGTTIATMCPADDAVDLVFDVMTGQRPTLNKPEFRAHIAVEIGRLTSREIDAAEWHPV